MSFRLTRRSLLATAATALATNLSAQTKRVRIAVIGVGGRGTGVLRASLATGDVDVTALCDIRPEAANAGVDLVQTRLNTRPATYTNGPTDYRRMLQRDDIDAVFITTPAILHASMSIDALRAKKWVFSEVPACNTIEEGWSLIYAVEETGMGYFMAENYIFTRDNLMVLNMVNQGVFGDLTFSECGYIHNTRELQFNADGTLTWRGEEDADPRWRGNVYPTHSLGPACQALGITRGDRFTECVSMMTPARGFHEYAVRHFPDSPSAKIDTWNGDNTLTLLKTANGAVVYLRFDNASPRPHRMGFYTLQGTKASYDDSLGYYVDGKSDAWEPGSKYYAQYDHPYWLRNSEKARAAGHSGGDYFTLQHFYRSIRAGQPPGIDVYDAVTWSALMPLSAKSLQENSKPQEVPDFTGGKWRSRKRYDWSNA